MPLTEAELLAILSTPEADRTPEQKSALAEAMKVKTDEQKPAKRETPDTWAEIFEHPRFKELAKVASDSKTRADALEKAAQEAERKRLEEEKNYQKLYEQAQAEITSLKPKAEQLDSMEKTLSALLDTQVKELPEQFRDIVPDGLSTQAKLDWLSKNRSKFSKPEPFDIGAGAKGGKKPEDKEGELSPEEKEAAKSLAMSEEDYKKFRDPSSQKS